MISSPALAAFALVALYAVGWMHGRTNGPPGAVALRCECTEATRMLSVREDLTQGDVQAVAECVLHDRPTRGVLCVARAC